MQSFALRTSRRPPPLAISVNTLVDEADGSIVDGDISLRGAIAASPAGSTINLSVTGAIHLAQALGAVQIRKDLTIAGPDAADYVLHDFSGTERSEVALLVSDAADAVESLVAKGLVAAQQEWHSR